MRVPPDALTILHVGCGAGLLGAALKEEHPGRRVVGIESDTARAGAAAGRLGEVYTGDPDHFNPPFARGEFDCIVCSVLPGRTPDPRVAISRFVPYLAPGGRFVLLAPVARCEDDGSGFPSKDEYLEIMAASGITADAARFIGGSVAGQVRAVGADLHPRELPPEVSCGAVEGAELWLVAAGRNSGAAGTETPAAPGAATPAAPGTSRPAAPGATVTDAKPERPAVKAQGLDANLEAAAAHAAAGRAAEALAIYKELFAENPDNCDVLNGLGYLCLQLSDAATAPQFFERVLALDPTNVRARRALESIAGHRRRSPGAASRGTVITRVVRPAPYWDTDPPFTAIMKQIPYTLVDPVRCYMLYQCALQASRLGGDAAEVGVYRGGTARLIASAMQESRARIHLFDTFEGMPSTDPAYDEHRQGDFSDTSLPSVQGNLAGLTNVAFYPGFFPATAPPVAHLKFSLAHIDVDIYRSVLDCCAFFYPRMVPGGIMVFDDYGFDTCPGAKQGVDEFFRETRERPWYLPSGQCVVVKLPPSREE